MTQSITDLEYQRLAAVFGPGLSMMDMCRKLWLSALGLPETSTLSNTDLEFLYYGGSGSMSERAYAFYPGSGSLSDNMYEAFKLPINTVNPFSNGPANLAQAVWADDPNWIKPADGGLVSSWRNAGNAGDLVNTGGTDRPVYVASDSLLGNQPSVIFNGVSTFVGSTLLVSVAQPYWLVFIGYAHISTAVMIGTGNSISSSLDGLCARLVSSSRMWSVQAGSNFNGTKIVIDNETVLVVAKANGLTSTVQVNSDSVAIGTTGSTNVPALQFYVGKGFGIDPQYYFNGAVHYAAIYTADPTLDPKWPVILEMARKCGVAV